MTTEQIEQAVLEKFRALPPDKQQEVLDFVEFLEQKNGVRLPRRSLMGLGSDLGIDISKEEIDEARREMWADFPRKDI